MLSKLLLRNYRCFENSEISFRDVAVLVGNNNAGKSTLVEALRIVGECAQKFKHAKYVQAPPELALPATTRGFYMKLDALRIDLRTIVYRYRNDVFAEIKAYFSNNACIKVFLSSDLVFSIIESNGQMITNRSLAIKQGDFQLYILPQIGLIREEEKLLSHDTITSDMSSRLSSRHFRNELYMYRDQHFDTFRSLAQETWPGLRIADISYEYGETINLLITDNDYAAEIGMMGSGLQMWLQIIWFISHCPKSGTIVLDEPDVYMHPDLQRRILSLVKQRFAQIILATHSVEIISAVEPRQIVTVDKKSRKMQYANNYKAVQDVISNLGSEHNLSLVRLGNAKKCVFVEGKDIATLRKIQDVLYPNAPVSVDQLPTVALGGWSRFIEALGAARLFYEETKGDIKTYCILDRDYHSDEEIQQLHFRANENHLDLHVWSKKELENYLLVPKALARVAGIKQEGQEWDEFQEGLFHELDVLYNDIEGSKLNELYKKDRSKAPGVYLPEAKRWLESNWGTLESRLSIACGKDVISIVNTWIREKYNKSSSRSKIIAALRPEDIPFEMKQVIDELLS